MLDRMMVASYIAALVCLCLIDALAASLKGVSLPRMCLGKPDHLNEIIITGKETRVRALPRHPRSDCSI